MPYTRAVKEGPLVQGEDEEIAYNITTTPWGSSPTSPAVKAYDVDNDYNDVSSTVLSGSPSVVGDVITTPVVKALTAGITYRIEVEFTCAGNVFECYLVIKGER